MDITKLLIFCTVYSSWIRIDNVQPGMQWILGHCLKIKYGNKLYFPITKQGLCVKWISEVILMFYPFIKCALYKCVWKALLAKCISKILFFLFFHHNCSSFSYIPYTKWKWKQNEFWLAWITLMWNYGKKIAVLWPSEDLIGFFLNIVNADVLILIIKVEKS